MDGSVVLNLIFAKLEMTCKVTPKKPQRRVLKELFRVLLAFRGRATFTNLARFSVYHEQTFRHHFERFFDWVGFNLAILRLRVHPLEPLVGVFDCGLLPKGGTETYGIDRFFCSRAGRSERGLEVSLLGVVAAKSRRTTVLDVMQTPARLSVPAKKAAASYTRMDFYLEQVVDVLCRLDWHPRGP
jgi:hypothetical protein